MRACQAPVLLLLAVCGLAAGAAAAKASAPDVVLIGLSNRQCNAASGLNLAGSKTMLTGDNNLMDSPGGCCSACKLLSDCNVWTYCSSPQGCDAGGRYRECTLKQDSGVYKQQRVISKGSGWVSGFIKTRCPGSDAKKLLALQRINFPSFTSQCQPGSSCTACMCQLSKAMTTTSSDPLDLSLCINNFRTVMMFPADLGGSSLSAAAYQRLASCPVSDPPCTDQKAVPVFATAGPATMPSNLGQTLTCLTGKKERECAQACLATPGCNGFTYGALSATARCCLVSGPGQPTQLSTVGEQMYYQMPAGTTAEDGFFTQRTPWAGGSASTAASTAVPTFTAASAPSPVGGSGGAPALAAAPASTAACSGAACADAAPPGGWSCAQQKAWGKCSEAWMAPYCRQTCGRCPCTSAAGRGNPPATSTPSPSTDWAGFFSSPAPSSPSPSPSATATDCKCSDVPPNRYSCAKEAAWGKCGAGYMHPNKEVPEGFCQITCKRCNCPLVKKCGCSDLQPPGRSRCSQHVGWGNCGKEWMWRAYDDRPDGYCQLTCGRCKC